MKKTFSMLLAAALCVSVFSACGNDAASKTNSTAEVSTQAPDTQTATTQEPDTQASELSGAVSITYPVEIENELGVTVIESEPNAIAVFDVGMLDILDTLGFGDRVVAVTHGQAFPDYLSQYDGDMYVNLGGFKDWDEEALSNSNPDLIFAGFRQNKSIETVTAVAPTIYFTQAESAGTSYISALEQRIGGVTTLFGGEEEAERYLSEIREKVSKIQAFTAQNEVSFVMVSAENGALSMGGAGDALLVTDLGLVNLYEDTGMGGRGEGAEGGRGGAGGESEEGGREGAGDEARSAAEGGAGGRMAEGEEEVDTEAQTAETVAHLVETDPDYIFVFDKDAAEREEGQPSAEDIVAAAGMESVSAYENGNVICVDNTVWGSTTGGLRATIEQLDTLIELFGLN